MKAIDANVLLRLIVADDRGQEATARALIMAGPVFVPITVTLECEWVLRSFYKLSPLQIAEAINGMTDVHNLFFEHLIHVRWSLDRLVVGADFADMIHIAQANEAGASTFVTFDADISAEAGPDTPIPIETLA